MTQIRKHSHTLTHQAQLMSWRTITAEDDDDAADSFLNRSIDRSIFQLDRHVRLFSALALQLGYLSRDLSIRASERKPFYCPWRILRKQEHLAEEKSSN